jgi:NAD(P)H-dependent FMN reductase
LASPVLKGMHNMKVGIIIGSTRPGRVGPQVASWIHELASQRADAAFEIIDVADLKLPFLDEPIPPSLGQYSKEHTKSWARKVAALDAFIFVTPEYNHSTSPALKTAIDFIYAEWNNKAAGFVSYGSGLGLRAVEHLRGMMAELQIADVRSQVALSLFDDFENFTTFKPRDIHLPAAQAMLDQLIGWGLALKRYRQEAEAARLKATA